jgi:hypothetical protein
MAMSTLEFSLEAFRIRTAAESLHQKIAAGTIAAPEAEAELAKIKQSVDELVEVYASRPDPEGLSDD